MQAFPSLSLILRHCHCHCHCQDRILNFQFSAIAPAAMPISAPVNDVSQLGSNSIRQVGQGSKNSSHSWIPVSMEGMVKGKSQSKGIYSLVQIQECNLLEWSEGQGSYNLVMPESSLLDLCKGSNNRHWDLEHNHWWTILLLTVRVQESDGVCLAMGLLCFGSWYGLRL